MKAFRHGPGHFGLEPAARHDIEVLARSQPAVGADQPDLPQRDQAEMATSVAVERGETHEVAGCIPAQNHAKASL
jgi:hypothetical protein